jgi:putative transcriptional regulator
MSESLAGQCLIALKHLRDPNFFRSVVLMVEHGSTGAMGLVINRPSRVSVVKALEGHFEFPESSDLVYTGGPVEQAALFIMHNSAELGGSEPPLIPGLFVGSSAETFEEVVRNAAEGRAGLKYRILAGYSGWAPDQLESEISRGDWRAVPATADQIFQNDPYTLWDLLTNQVSPTRKLAPHPSNKPEWN